MNDGGVGLVQIADALQVPMMIDKGRVKGFRNRKMKLGGWVLNRPIKVEHDFFGNGKAGVFCKLSGDLWAYVLSAPDVLVLVLFDGRLLDSAFATGNADATLKMIQPWAVASFSFDPSTDKWKNVEFGNLVDRYREAGRTVPITSPDI